MVGDAREIEDIGDDYFPLEHYPRAMSTIDRIVDYFYKPSQIDSECH